MGDDEFNEDEIDWDEVEREAGGYDASAGVPSYPSFRATITASELRVTTWLNFLIPPSGPASNLFRSLDGKGVSIADLYVHGGPAGPDLTVTYLTDGAGSAGERRLVDWAAQVGYVRVWLPDRVEELESLPTGRAHVTCPGCGFEWQDGSADFWAQVHGDGRFPSICVLCCNDLPQWTVAPPARRHAKPAAKAGKRAAPAIHSRGPER